MKLSKQANYIFEIKQILEKARQKAYSAVNFAMVEAYWLVGQKIVQEEQNGKERAAYGKEIIKNLSEELTNSLGKGYSERSLREFRQFYKTFPDLLQIGQTVSDLSGENIRRTPFAISENEIWRTPFAKLHWSHYQRVLRISDAQTRMYYLTEAANQNWSISTLDRNISTLYYQRLLSSQKNEAVKSFMEENTSAKGQDANEFIKNPTVKYSVLSENKQLFANKYLPYLPTENELIAEIECEKLFINQRLGL